MDICLHQVFQTTGCFYFLKELQSNVNSENELNNKYIFDNYRPRVSLF